MSKSQNHLFALPAADLAHILRLAEDELDKLRGRKLFITGGTGFFGKWLLGALLHANTEMNLQTQLTVMSRDPIEFIRRSPGLSESENLEFLRGDVASLRVDRFKIDYIIHAAADTTAFTDDADERARARTIRLGIQNMLSAAQVNRARMLNVSSGAVYGTAASKQTGASESDFAESEAVTPYGKAKREAERFCAGTSVDYVTARAFAFLGPHLPLDAHFAAGNFLRDAMRGVPIEVRGDGTALRSYLHPADLVVWLLRILIRGERGRAYNVGSDESVTTAQLARLIAESVRPKAEVVIQSVQPQGPQNIYLPNIARARTELKLDVAIRLQDAIARTVAYLGKNPTGVSQS